jgi:hypothetical protein
VVKAIDISNKDQAEMEDKDKFSTPLKHLLNKKPMEIESAKRVPEVSQNCYWLSFIKVKNH